MTPDEARAISDELSALDASITASAARVLRPAALIRWRPAWASYTDRRARYVQAVARTGYRIADSSLQLQVSDRLSAVMDIVQSEAGAQLYASENLYARVLEADWRAIRLAIISLVMALGIGAALAVLITRRLASGLGHLAMTARAITRGAVETRADERGGDEIALLATAFNHMTDALLSAERRADSDALTGLPNHRACVAALDRELERGRRYNRPCALLFLDIDHFKALNDGCGHSAGDAALREFSDVVRTTLRDVDILGRWGGEEFVVILPEAGSASALAAAERLRMAVAARVFAAGGGVHLTCSIGVATYPYDGEERERLVELADHAMYTAKRLGRNQVRAAGDPAVAPLLAEVGAEGSREHAALVGTVEALVSLVEARDDYTGRHTVDVAALSVGLALALDLGAPEAQRIGLAARLHDVGKIGVPDAVLRKPGRLTEDEWTLMRQHPGVGADVVSRVPALRTLAPIIRAHHEHWDGRGYPDGIAEQAIPLGARIVAVADAYAAMMTDRSYRQARPPLDALAEVRRCAGTQFDPAVVEALARALGESRAVEALDQAG